MSKKFNRIFTIVVDSWGYGSMPDAAKYGDEGADTMGHIADSVETLNLPNLQQLWNQTTTIFALRR